MKGEGNREFPENNIYDLHIAYDHRIYTLVKSNIHQYRYSS